MKSPVTVFLFNAPIGSGCDYVSQTMRQVPSAYPVYAIALGDILSVYKWIVSKDKWIFRSVHGARVIRPLSVLPGVRNAYVRNISYISWTSALRLYLALRYPGRKRVLWFFEPFHMRPLLRIFAGYVRLYDCVDYYPGFSANARIEHDACLTSSEFVFANSAPLAKRLRRTRKDVMQVPLGFAEQLFTNIKTVPVMPNIKDFTVGYVGSMSSRMDFRLLHAVIAGMPDTRFRFIGPLEQDVFGTQDSAGEMMDGLLRYPNVTWIPGVPKRRLPGELLRIDMGIIPYRHDLSFNRYSFPMKTLEYFAAGMPVISGKIDALIPYSDSGLLTMTDSPDGYIGAIRNIQRVGWPKRMQLLQRKHAIAQSWSKKVEAIMSYVIPRIFP